jgi:hypothetical protein
MEIAASGAQRSDRSGGAASGPWARMPDAEHPATQQDPPWPASELSEGE